MFLSTLIRLPLHTFIAAWVWIGATISVSAEEVIQFKVTAEEGTAVDPSPHWLSTSVLNSKSRILDLRWTRIEKLAPDAKGKKRVRIFGEYLATDWALMTQTETLARPNEENREFSLVVTATGASTPITIYAVGPLGEVQSEVFQLTFGKLKKLKVSQKRKFHIIPSIGLTSISYQESGISDFSRVALTAKLSLGGPLFWQRVEWGASAYVSALPVNTETVDAKVRFFGANLRGGYVVTPLESDWSFALSLGVSYSTMFVDKPKLGYQDLFYPQFYPSLRKKISRNSDLMFYVKYVSLGEGNKWLSFKDREIASGLSFSRILTTNRLWNVSLDYSDLKLNLSATKYYRVKNFSVSVGYGI